MMMLEFLMGPMAMILDITQFYPSMHLRQKHWTFQRVLLTDNMRVDGVVIEGIIKKLIFGVCCSGGQCEEVLRRLSEEGNNITGEVVAMLLKHCYVDDFMKSLHNKEEAVKLAKSTDEALAQMGMKNNGWVFANEAPDKELTQDGESAKVGGIIWYPELDCFKLGISPLFFKRKKRGRPPPGTIKFEEGCGVDLLDLVPEKITRELVTSMTLKIWDPFGRVAPITNKFKDDLRRLARKCPD